MTNFNYELIKLWDEYMDYLSNKNTLSMNKYTADDFTFLSFMNWVRKMS